MEVHQGAVEASSEEKIFQFIEKYRASWPGISAFSMTEYLPLRVQIFIVGQDRVFGMLAEKHLANDGLATPETTTFVQINAIESAGVLL